MAKEILVIPKRVQSPQEAVLVHFLETGRPPALLDKTLLQKKLPVEFIALLSGQRPVISGPLTKQKQLLLEQVVKSTPQLNLIIKDDFFTLSNPFADLSLTQKQRKSLLTLIKKDPSLAPNAIALLNLISLKNSIKNNNYFSLLESDISSFTDSVLKNPEKLKTRSFSLKILSHTGSFLLFSNHILNLNLAEEAMKDENLSDYKKNILSFYSTMLENAFSKGDKNSILASGDALDSILLVFRNKEFLFTLPKNERQQVANDVVSSLVFYSKFISQGKLKGFISKEDSSLRKKAVNLSTMDDTIEFLNSSGSFINEIHNKVYELKIDQKIAKEPKMLKRFALRTGKYANRYSLVVLAGTTTTGAIVGFLSPAPGGTAAGAKTGFGAGSLIVASAGSIVLVNGIDDLVFAGTEEEKQKAFEQIKQGTVLAAFGMGASGSVGKAAGLATIGGASFSLHEDVKKGNIGEAAIDTGLIFMGSARTFRPLLSKMKLMVIPVKTTQIAELAPKNVLAWSAFFAGIGAVSAPELKISLKTNDYTQFLDVFGSHFLGMQRDFLAFGGLLKGVTVPYRLFTLRGGRAVIFAESKGLLNKIFSLKSVKAITNKNKAKLIDVLFSRKFLKVPKAEQIKKLTNLNIDSNSAERIYNVNKRIWGEFEKARISGSVKQGLQTLKKSPLFTK
ncbi:hypothetical protein KAW38_03270 [Candidatus Micrarchaeota archaeon]|nr:hypothetical protein [Candidatus Micrarchaeota archaeon]